MTTLSKSLATNFGLSKTAIFLLRKKKHLLCYTSLEHTSLEHDIMFLDMNIYILSKIFDDGSTI